MAHQEDRLDIERFGRLRVAEVREILDLAEGVASLPLIAELECREPLG